MQDLPQHAALMSAAGWWRAMRGAQGSTQAGPLRTATLQSAGGSDPAAQGSDLSVLQGVRIATPFFGTGYNFCIGAHP